MRIHDRAPTDVVRGLVRRTRTNRQPVAGGAAVVERSPGPFPAAIGRLRSQTPLGVVPLLTAAATFVLASLVASFFVGHSVLGSTSGVGRPDLRPAPDSVLTADTDFLITSAVSSTSACADVALFLPGKQEFLCYTVHNPYTEPFTVTSAKIAKTTAPPNCPVANLDLTATTYSGTPKLVVAAHASGVIAEPISMVASPTTQDACLGTTFTFTNAGTALVTTPAVTTTTTTAPVPTSTTTPTTVPPAAPTTTAPATPLASTGVDIAATSLAGALALAVGGLLLLVEWRRRRRAVTARAEGTPS